MKKISPQSAGFSLVELLLYMGLSAMILTTIASLLLTVTETQINNSFNSALEQDGNYIINKLHYEVNRSQELTLPSAIGESGQQLTLVVDGQTKTFALVGGNLDLTENSLTYHLNSSLTSLTQLEFTRLGNEEGKPALNITFTLTGLNQSGQADSRSYQTTVILK